MNCKDCKYSHDTGTALLCWGQRFAPPVDADDWCEGWKPRNVTPQTNADRIRAMTDEELAKYINEISNGDCPTVGDCPEGVRENETCTPWQCWLYWLKSPVEEVYE